MALSVAELQPVLHQLFNETAQHLARETGFCKRDGKLTGPVFSQCLVGALMQRPDATLEDFAEAAFELFDEDVTGQAFDKRFTGPAADFLRELFLDAFNASFASLRPAVLPLLRRFNGVYLRDATLVPLPDCLAGVLPGRGGRHCPHGRAAALKLVVEAEVSTSALTEVSLLAGLDNDRLAEVAGKPLPKGALLLEDMGFFSGDRLQAYVDQGVYVLSRVPAWTAFFDPAGGRLDLVRRLRKHWGDTLELPVRVLHGHQLRLRLPASRVPEEEAERRRERVRKEAKQRGRPVSQKKLELCGWNLLVTNAPPELLGVREAGVARRVRWQVELVFKVFKSEGGIARTRSPCPHRVLCGLYAKLLGQVVQHWALLAAGYAMLRHSARRAARRVRKRALRLLGALGRLRRLARQVARLARELHRHGYVVRRKAEPSTLDRLAALDPEADPLGQAA